MPFHGAGRGAGLFARSAVCQASTLILKLAEKRAAVQRGSISPSVTQTWSAHCPRAQRPLCHVVASHGKVQNVAINLWPITGRPSPSPGREKSSVRDSSRRIWEARGQTQHNKKARGDQGKRLGSELLGRFRLSGWVQAWKSRESLRPSSVCP